VNNRLFNDVIAKKYAQAFINVYASGLTGADCDAYESARKFLQTHHRALFFLQLPQLDDSTKKAMIADIVARFNMPDETSKLFWLLIMHDRSFYIPRVLFFIVRLYKRQHAIVDFSVISSHPLDEHKAASIQNFLQHSINKRVVCTYSVNKYLIAGVRMRSDEYMWEYSARKQIDSLRALAQ
jgi:ATP synthase F1 delta subunit